MWTTGGCYDNWACFCVMGGQLSLRCWGGTQGGKREGGKMARKEGKEEEKIAWENKGEVKQRCDDIKEKLQDQRKVTSYNLTY